MQKDMFRITWLVAAAALGLAACAPAAPALAPATEQPTPAQATTEAPTATAISELTTGSFEVGDGRSLYVTCHGEGSPTVIFEAGDESGIEQWSTVQPRISALTRTCAYDRGGIGQSDPVSGCRQLPDLTNDLSRLLEAAQIPGPYVMVSTSGGGYIAAGFAATHRDDIAGMLFIDTFRANPNPPPDLVANLACDNPANRERRDYLQVEADTWNNRAEIGDIPVTIITVKYGPDEGPEEQMNVEAQQGWLALSPRAIQVVVDTGQHNVVGRDPTLVIQEITKVVEAARSNP
jgi:pimeloyl-ACP methyl ester carboxylesterase